jgi:hypothetical protein
MIGTRVWPRGGGGVRVLIAALVSRMVGNPGYRAAALALGHALRAEDGTRPAVAMLDRLSR